MKALQREISAEADRARDLVASRRCGGGHRSSRNVPGARGQRVLNHGARRDYIDDLLAPVAAGARRAFSTRARSRSCSSDAEMPDVAVRLSVADDMALVGVISTQLIVHRFINHFPDGHPWNLLFRNCGPSSLITFSLETPSGRFTFSDDDSFSERGIVDSTGILELVCHLQERYGIDITDAELVPENLDSGVEGGALRRAASSAEPVIAVRAS